MMAENAEWNDTLKPINVFTKTLLAGATGGILWSILSVILYYFNFTEVAPKSFLLRPWFITAWADQWQGHLLSIILSGILSLIPAIIYYLLFRKFNTMWIGAAYGIGLWIVLFYMLQPLFPRTVPVTELSQETVVTTLCLFILYGVFIGYSISFDYHEMKIKQNQKKT